MADRKTVPTRGVKKDWYGDKEQQILDDNKDYARKSIQHNLLGSPDFKLFESFLVKPVENIDANAQNTTAGKPKRKKIT